VTVTSASNDPVRVLISYAHGEAGHEERVRQLWVLLRAEGVDAKLDVAAAAERQFWPEWMSKQLRMAAFVLVVASPRYRERAEGSGDTSVGRGVRWEARQLQERLYADPENGIREVIPVILPGDEAAGLPDWVHPIGGQTYSVPALTADGIDELVRVLTGQPLYVEPPLGPVRPRPPRSIPLPEDQADETATDDEATAGPPAPLRTEVVIEANRTGDRLTCRVSMAGTAFDERTGRVPDDVDRVWESQRAGSLAANERILTAGRALAAAVFDEAGRRSVADLVGRLRPGDWVDVVVTCNAEALGLPFELMRLTAPTGEDLGPLGLIGGVTVRRRLAARSDAGQRRVPVPGPLKVLAAVAAPEETKTANVPLDVEAEMQAVLDAVGDLAAGGGGQVRILEVASLAEIGGALRTDAYHVLHLSAHGSTGSVELEDEDGSASPVTTQDLIGAIRDSGSPVPLIVLSSCSGAAGRGGAMAAGLVRSGADRVIAMQTSVTDEYATALTAALYAELAGDRAQPVASALAQARRGVHRRIGSDGDRPPEFGVATLMCAGDDPPLVDRTAPAIELKRVDVMPSGASVRELPVGRLVGRRTQVRKGTAALRRTPKARQVHGLIGGVQLLGIGGIGKTAVAGRLITRLRADGVRIAVHEGRWNPTALFAAVAKAISDLPDHGDAVAALTAPTLSGTAKAEIVGQLLAAAPLLVVFDDFEQNLTAGGAQFHDPAFDDLFTGWCEAAEAGAVLVTCRYPLPDDDRYLVRIPVPPLSTAELSRLFLRHPALADLPAADRLLLTRVIGGHPRLVEYVDALVRGKPTQLRSVQNKLRDLARKKGIDLRRPRPVGTAIDNALLLGGADILLDELLDLLTEDQHRVLDQISVSRADMTLDDLAGIVEVTDLQEAVERLTDLTLLTPGPDIQMHPWTAEILDRRAAGSDRRPLHQRALDMRMRRFGQRRGGYGDLLDLPRHWAALGQYDEIAGLADAAAQMLPGALATSAYLAEIRPMVPTDEPAWFAVAKAEYEAVRAAGNLPIAHRLLTDMHEATAQRAATDPAASADLNVVLVDLGDLATATGRLADAHIHYTDALTAAEEHLGNHPADRTDAWWTNRPTIARNRLGDVAVAAGDLAAATEHYQAGLAIREKLAATDPTNSLWQRDLSLSRERLGDVAVAAGDLAAAAAHYETTLAIRERLAAADPTNTEWQRDLSVSRNKLGDVAQATGDLTTATAHYQASLAIREKLAATDPTNAEWQRNLSISLGKLGDVAQAGGNLAAAAAHYQAGMAIAERLAAADPTNSQWQRDLSISRGRLGDVAVAAGDVTTAIAHYQASLAIRERLAAADPTNTEWQRDLSSSRSQLGDLARTAGDLLAASTHYRAGMAITERLATADPTNTQWQRDHSISRNKLGDLARAAGDLTTATAHYQAGLAICERLAAADPTNTQWQRDLSISRERLGDVALAAGDLTTAAEHYQADLAITERLATIDPTNTHWQRDLSISWNKLGNLAEAAGDRTTAIAHYQASLAIRERLAAADPTNTQWQRDLSYVTDRLADLAPANEQASNTDPGHEDPSHEPS
jgi:tetratricopeptide (TPR) repeat protein